LRFDAELFTNFFRMLPRDTSAAARLAARHDNHVAGRAVLSIGKSRPLRHAVEIRNRSFVDAAFVELLRRYEVALVVADTAGKWPYCEDVTADFIYLRLHGDIELYASGYSDAALDRWASRIRAWHAGGQPEDAHLIDKSAAPSKIPRAVFCYFDNDIKVKAPFDAANLLDKLGLKSPLLTQEPCSEIRSAHRQSSHRSAEPNQRTET
jgi:uncharacterized protein YecE (DUF72 family)